ncbi:DUF1045 domain-containing protein [Hydrogenophaga sp.]|uniref:DUF1045 domain-containing protein n=1 Tax=Hydrogenophaga sp. TaxID=1904254 RepID=UPI0025BAE966|nr:DUF1045 domain-containing protein [Hydrogenophaga sp.]
MSHDTLAPHRVAIYAAPAPGTDWWERGSEWLGRCASRRCTLPMPVVDGVDPSVLTALTADPRRYGWHATLKAPLRLAPHANLWAFRDALAAICREHRAIDLGDMQVARLGSFLALRPEKAPAALGALADDCVRRLQPLAAPLNEHELARRRRAPLTPEEDALMLAWGYPWVLQKFRFHFSLTGPLAGVPDDVVGRLLEAATRKFGALPPLRLDRLSVFIEPSPGADFVLLEQMELGA